MTTATSTSIEIRRADPLAHADAIKRLFATHDRPEFSDYFDRAFPPAGQDVSSWIGIDGNDQVTMHVASFRHRFSIGERVATGGLLVNLLTAREHRSFFPTLRLLRQAIRDSRDDGDLDFLYGDPNQLALPLLRATGFVPIGELERFVLPLRAARWPADAVVRAYHTILRVARWRGGTRASESDASAIDVDSLAVPSGVSPMVRPHRPAALYARRLADYPGPEYRWFIVRAAGGRELARVLIRDAGDGTAVLCTLQRGRDAPLSAIVPPLAKSLRHSGHATLWLWTLAGTRFAEELRRSGFHQRNEHLPVLGTSFTELGAEVLEGAAMWETTHLDYDR